MTRIATVILFALAGIACANSEVIADAARVGDRCFADGASITVTGAAVPRRLVLANGNVSEVWLLMLDRPLCVLGAQDGDLSRASNVQSLQIVGQRPPTDSKIELDGRLSTVNVTQYYAVPTAITVSAGRRINRSVAQAATPKFDADDVATLLKKVDTEEQKRAAAEKTEMNGWAILLLALILYFCPTGIAFRRGHHNRNAIFVLNLFLGWTLLGWVAALVWANTQT